MLRKLAVVLASALVFNAAQARALGLGEITLDSALNQPLSAKIELLDLRGVTADQIIVALASEDDFQRFNINREFFLTNIRYRVNISGADAFIELNSLELVREPYLSFIIDTRWPNGRLLSEYTLLLDLPVFAEENVSQPIRQPITNRLEDPQVNIPQNQPPTVDVSTPVEVPFEPAPSLPSADVDTDVSSPDPVSPEPASPEPVPAESANEAVADAVNDSDSNQPAQNEVFAAADPEPGQVEDEIDADADAQETEVATDSEPQQATEEPDLEVATEPEEAQPEEQPDVEVATEPEEAQPEEEPDVEIAAEPEPAAVAQEPEEDETGPQTLTTQSADTMWDIALRVRPDRSVTVQQTMLALQRLNRDAFIDDNINMIKRGQVLRLPTLSEIQALSVQQAISEVSRQNQLFTDRRRSSVGAEPVTAPTTGPSSQTVDSDGQLTVLTPDSIEDASTGSGAVTTSELAELDARVAELENQLALREEEEDRALLEFTELSQRMSLLEQQIASAQEIIRLQDLELAQLQASLAAAAAQESEPAEVETPTPVTAPAVSAESKGLLANLMDTVMGNIYLLIGLAFVLIAGLVVVLLRRNRGSEEEFEELQEFADDELEEDSDDFEDLSETVVDTDTTEDAVVEEVEVSQDEAFDKELDEIVSLTEDFDEAEEEEFGSGEAGEIDQPGELLDEVDIFIAYERYDEAVKVLQNGIVAEPDRTDLRLKLLEVFVAKQDFYGFKLQETELLEVSDDATREQITELRSKLEHISGDGFEDLAEDSVLTKEAEAEGEIEELDALDELEAELDLEASSIVNDEKVFSGTDPDSSLELDEVAKSVDDLDLADLDGDEGEAQDAEEEDATDFDFDLDFDDESDDETPVTETASSEEGVFDFDLDDEEESGENADTAVSSLEEGGISLGLDDSDTQTTTPESEADDIAEDGNSLGDDQSAADDTEVTKATGDDLDIETLEFDISAEDLPDTEKPADSAEVETDDEHSVDFDFGDDEETQAVKDAGAVDLGSDGEADSPALETEQKDDDFDFDLDDFDLEAEEKSTDSATAETGPEVADDLDNLEFLSAEDDKKSAPDELLDHPDDEDDLSFLTDSDEVATKLDLAIAYKEMGDKAGAREILEEVVKEGNDAQVADAKSLLEDL